MFNNSTSKVGIPVYLKLLLQKTRYCFLLFQPTHCLHFTNIPQLWCHRSFTTGTTSKMLGLWHNCSYESLSTFLNLIFFKICFIYFWSIVNTCLCYVSRCKMNVSTLVYIPHRNRKASFPNHMTAVGRSTYFCKNL